jgi:hypothetical protein
VSEEQLSALLAKLKDRLQAAGDLDAIVALSKDA